MSMFTYITNVIETEIDKDIFPIKTYEKNLPHHDQIIKTLTESWNKADMKIYYDGKYTKDKIHSCSMIGVKDKNTGETQLHIHFIMKPHVRLTENVKNELIDLTSAQISDGWGESYFGAINIMTDENGTRFYIE